MRDLQKEEVKHEDDIKVANDISFKNGNTCLENGSKHGKATNDLDRNTNNLSKMVAEKNREPAESSDNEEDIQKVPISGGVDELSQQIKSLSLSKDENTDTSTEPQLQIKKEAEESDDQDEGKKELNTRGPNGGLGRPMYPKAYEMSTIPMYAMQEGKRRMEEFDDPYLKYTRPGNEQQYYPANLQQNGYHFTGNNYQNWDHQTPPMYRESQTQFVINSQMPNNFSGATVTVKSPTGEMPNDFVEELLDMAASNPSLMNNCSVLSNDQIKNNNLCSNQMNFNLNNCENNYQNGLIRDKMPFQYQSSSCALERTANVPPGYAPPQMNDFTVSNEAITNRTQPPQVNNFNQIQKSDKGDTYCSESETELDKSPYSYQSHSPGSIYSLSSPPPSNLSGDSGIGGLDVDSPLQQDMFQSSSPGKPMSNAGSSPPRDIFTPPTPEAVGLANIKNELMDNNVCSSNRVPANYSAFVDEHLPELKDVLDVIGHDMIADNKKRHSSESEDSKSTNLKSPPSQPQALSPQGPQSVPPPATSPTVRKTVSPSIQVQPQVVQQQQQNMPSKTPPLMGTGVPATAASVVLLPPVSNPGSTATSQIPTTSTYVVLPPNTMPTAMPLATGQQPSTIIIVAPPVQPAQKPKPKGLRQIAPKMPSTSAQNGKNSTPVLTNTGTKNNTNTKAASSMRGPVVSPAVTQRPANAPQRVNNLLNVARRMVAEISRENLPFQDEEGDTYLHVAVCRTDPNMVQALLERLMRENLQGMVDVENNKRQTPLYLAVAANQAAMVNMFVKCNANPNTMAQVMSPDGRSVEVKAPIHVGSSRGHTYLRTLQELLKASDINRNIANSDGHTALHCAILSHGKQLQEGGYIDSIPIIELLLKSGIDANCQDKKCGKTPLMYAIEKKDVLLVEALLRMFEKTKLRSYVRSQTFDGRTCQKIAEGLKQDFHPEQWDKLWNLLDNACNGELPHIQLPYRQL